MILVRKHGADPTDGWVASEVISRPPTATRSNLVFELANGEVGLQQLSLPFPNLSTLTFDLATDQDYKYDDGSAGGG